MLRNQTKRQGSFYVCASCRRHQQHLAQLRPTSRIPNDLLAPPSRPFPSTFARLEARGYSSWGKFGSTSTPGQGNGAWGNTMRAPAFRGETGGTAAPTTGTPAWGGASKLNPIRPPKFVSASKGPSSSGGMTPPLPGGPARGAPSSVSQSPGPPNPPPAFQQRIDGTRPPATGSPAWGQSSAGPTSPTTPHMGHTQPGWGRGPGQTVSGWGRLNNPAPGGMHMGQPSPPSSPNHFGAPSSQSNKPPGSTSGATTTSRAAGDRPSAPIPGRSTLGSLSKSPSQPAFGGSAGKIPKKPAFGGTTSPIPGNLAFGGRAGAGPGAPSFGGPPRTSPTMPAFDGASKPGPGTPVKSTSGFRQGNLPGPPSFMPPKSPEKPSLSHLSPEFLTPGYDAVTRNHSQPRPENSREDLRQRVQSVLDTPFRTHSSRDPEPGEEFPLLKRKSRDNLFESMSPFNLPTRNPQPRSTFIDNFAPVAATGFNILQSDSHSEQFSEQTAKKESSGTSWAQSPGGSTPESLAVKGEQKEERNRFDGRSRRDGGRPAREPDEWQDRQIERNSRKGKGSKKGEYAERRAEKATKSKNKSRKRGQVSEDQEEYMHEDAVEGMDIDELEAMHREEQRRRAQEQRLAEEAAKKAAVKTMVLPEYITVFDLADALRVKPKQFLRDLGDLGFENVLIDSVFTGETAALVASEYGYETSVESGEDIDLRPRPPPEDPSILPPRPPIVTIMGHVDHGKTTILDYMRKSSVAAQEFGGITQHIGAFAVRLSADRTKTLTFLDTPGHAAFLSMRQRGANVTDIVVLVVAVDDSVMPQTIEAIKHIQAAKVPVIVAINKIDLDRHRIGKVKDDLANQGIEIEDFGGDVQVVPVSAMTGEGMRDLEESILTLAEILDVRAETDGMAEGWILEATTKIDGRAATILVKRGTLRVGDLIVAGNTYTRVRTIRNEAGMDVVEAGPGTAVEIYGTWRQDPVAGDLVLQAPNETRAQAAVDYRIDLEERGEAAARKTKEEADDREEAARKALEAEMAELLEDEDKGAREETPEDNGPKLVNIIVRGDVMGSVEAVTGALQEIGNNEVQARVLRSSPGQITESDISLMTTTTTGCIVNFNNAIPGHIQRQAAVAGVRIVDRNIIYEAIDEVKSILSELLEPKYWQRVVAEAEVMAIFPINIVKRKYKNVAGVRVTNNTITRGGQYRVMRDGVEIHKGKLQALKNVKKDVNEMKKGSECGMMFEDFEDFQVGDIIQRYEDVEEKRYL